MPISVVEEAGGIVATGALADLGTPGSPMPSASQFFVRPDLHGRGIGTFLMKHLREIARTSGVTCLRVPSSRNAISFYRSTRFTVDVAQPDSADEITWMTMNLEVE